MNITTDKVVSNSIDYQKKVRDTENISGKEKIKEKLLKDFSSAASNDKYIKAKIKNNNIRLTAYENNVSKNQFIESKLEEVSRLVKEGKMDEAWEVIRSSKFDNKEILSGNFTKNAPLAEQVDYFKLVNAIDKLKLEKEFVLIQIASQNLSSISSDFKNLNKEYNTADNISSESFNDMKIDSKRVLELVSKA